MTDGAPEITDAELVAFFAAIEAGELELTLAGADPQEVYAGDVRYRASNGWQLVVFNDANAFDYVSDVYTEDGRWRGHDTLEGTAAAWQPDDETAWRVLGVPGYGLFRCKACGAPLPAPHHHGDALLCGGGTCRGARAPAVPTRAHPAGRG